MTQFIFTKPRAERMILLAHECIGLQWEYTEFSLRGSIVRNKWVNPQLKRPRNTIKEDCTSAIEGLAFASALPDPSGFGYKPVGNTTSMRDHLRNIKSTDVRPGDILLYRRSDGVEHGVFVLGGFGHTADVFTFGEPPGPRLEAADYRTDFLCGLVYASPILGHR